MSVQTQDTLHHDCEIFFRLPLPKAGPVAAKTNSHIATHAIEALTPIK